jgi:MraZ protein
MFLGQFERTLDDKSRLAVPAELRSGLGPGAVLTCSFDKCLCIYPASRWESLARAIEDLRDTREEVRVLARNLFGCAVPCEFDRQGRVGVPAFLREFADLGAEVVVVGVNTRVEIWSREAWLNERRRFESRGAAIAQSLSIASA